MVAYNFQPRFAELVAGGLKRMTIRKARNGRGRHARPGEPIQLFTGMRTKDCRKLIDPDPRVISAQPVVIDETGIKGPPGASPLADVTDRGVLDHIAKADGFASWPDMLSFFAETHGLPFAGVLIRWELD